MTENNMMNPNILIVDDMPENLKILRDTLEPENYRIVVASNGKLALRAVARALPDIILLDVVMPGMDGYEVCRQLKQNHETAHIPVIFITVRADDESLMEGFRVGGVDYITKPFKKEELLTRVETHLKIGRLMQELLQKNRELQEKNRVLQEEISRREQAEKSQQQAEKAREQAEYALQKADEQLSMISQQEVQRWGITGFVGKSKTIGKILADVRKLQSAGTTNVLITGESGTGKELIARAIHFGGTRAKGPFIPLNCPAIPSELAESTLFGHIRGAFTGANKDRKGCFELADGGTLFLDEIGDMPLLLQAKLLRVMEDGCIVPVGGTHEKHVDVRILAATNQALRANVAEGTFRNDLYFRLAQFCVNAPPLRERKEDIPLLTEHFLSMFATEMGMPHQAFTLSPEAKEALEAYHFPGNVRELKNIIEHALLIMSGESVIKPEHLRFIDVSDVPTSSPPTPEQNAEHPADTERLKELVIKRSQKSKEESEEPSEMTNEEKVLAYIKEHGSINNSECQHLLSVNLRHASYLLNKLCQYGLLERKGKRRWARYYPHQ